MLHLITILHHVETTLPDYIMTAINVFVCKVYHNLLLTSGYVESEAFIPWWFLSGLCFRSLCLLSFDYNKYVRFNRRTADALGHPKIFSFNDLYSQLAIFHDPIGVEDLFCAGDLKFRLEILNNLLPSLHLWRGFPSLISQASLALCKYSDEVS